MKKSTIVILLLLISMLLACTACNANSTKNSSGEVTTGNSTEAPHTVHTGNAVCDVCGIDYFDTLAEYIKANAKDIKEDSDQITYTIYVDTTDDSCRLQYFEYSDDEDNNCIRVWKDISTYNKCFVAMTKNNLKFGECNWYYYCQNITATDGSSISGILNNCDIYPHRSSPLTPSSSSFKSEADKQSALNSAQLNIYSAIVDVIVPAIEACGNNLTPVNFGFEKFA